MRLADVNPEQPLHRKSDENEADDDSDARVKRGGPPLVDRIPERYQPGKPDELTFEVPAGGTDKADFPLTSP